MGKETSAETGCAYTFVIREAGAADIGAVEQLYNDVLEKQERETNYTNWQRGLYPTRADAERAQQAGTLYVAEANGPEMPPRTIAGAVILNHDQPEEYGNLKWSVEAEGEEVLVAHTLCISPHFRNTGLGRKFVVFAEELAKSQGCRTVRFDTYEGNTPATALYTKLGYTIVDNSLTSL